MTKASLSLALLGLVFGIGAMTADGPAILAGSRSMSVLATLAVVALLFAGVFAWYRMVKAAHRVSAAAARSKAESDARTPAELVPKALTAKQG